MFIEAIKSKIITSKDSLLIALQEALKERPLKQDDILVITSKVVAITEGKIVKITKPEDFEQLVVKESDQIIGGEQVTLSLKNHIFIPWAGIDRSNIQKGFAVLWPKNSFKTAEELQKKLCKLYNLQKLGVIIIDSWCAPLRKGVTAIALGYSGFKGVNDLRGQKDLHGNALKVTQQNIADMLAASANLVMGESNEATPFAIIQKAPVVFSNEKVPFKSLIIKEKDCLYAPLYKNLHQDMNKKRKK